MDVAEQALTALEILSRRHSKQILNATQSGSVSACLTYIDFFSIAAQRNALQITANCCQNMVKDEFVHIQSSLPILSQRLACSDKKSVESVCAVFARLVENFQHEPVIVKEMASHGLLSNLQQLLILQPPLLSQTIFVNVLHTIYLMCAHCNELAVELIDTDIAGTLKTLLVGKAGELLPNRSPQELYEIVSILGEIMPRLPRDGLFTVDEILSKTSLTHHNELVAWHWKDEREVWRPYTPVDSRLVESAFAQEEDECVLNALGRTYVIDFNSMLQINEETGTARPVQRKSVLNNDSKSDASNDNRLTHLKQQPDKYVQFVISLFEILYEIYNSSAGPSIKHRSLRAILRMIFYLPENDPNNNDKSSKPGTLYSLLKSLPISSHIASMLASSDTKIIISALQIAEILMQRLPDVFAVYFRREGVLFQIDKLLEVMSQPILAETKPELRKTRAAAAAAANEAIKRKARSAQAAAKANLSTARASGLKGSSVYFTRKSAASNPTSTEPNNTSAPAPPTEQNTAAPTSSNKYFRGFISKLHGSSSSNQTSSNVATKPTTASPFQGFSILPSSNTSNQMVSSSTAAANTQVSLILFNSWPIFCSFN